MSYHWGSHLSVLIRLMELTDGPVLELGTGFFSTPYLHHACYLRNRKLVSYENNPQYYKFLKKLETPWHEIHKVDDDWNIPETKRGVHSDKWGFIFIDVQPDSKRKDLAKMLRNSAYYIALHDSQPRDDHYMQYSKIYKWFKRRYDCTKFDPHTTVVSNYKELRTFNI